MKALVIHYQTKQLQSHSKQQTFLTDTSVILMLDFPPHILNPCAGIFVWKNVQGEIRCFTAIIANKIISTSGWTQYCTNMNPSHPQYDGVTAQILSVNMNWTTKIHRIHAWRASDSTAAISACIQMENKHALAHTFSSKHWILLCQWWLHHKEWLGKMQDDKACYHTK